MTHPIAYLSFDGKCAEAMKFYETVFNAKLEKLVTTAESPICDKVPPEAGDRIMHACLILKNGGILMGGDCMLGGSYVGMKGFSLTMNFDTVAEAEQVFHGLSDGAKISMPMQPAFWAEAWGMLTDRFGTPWIINGVMKQF